MENKSECSCRPYEGTAALTRLSNLLPSGQLRARAKWLKVETQDYHINIQARVTSGFLLLNTLNESAPFGLDD